MSLKKAIQDLINHSEQHQKGSVSEKLLSCRECYPLPKFESTDPFVKFWQTYQIINTQATYLSGRTKKAYEALVRKVLSAENAFTEQKNKEKITLYQKSRTKEVKVFQRYQIIPLLYTLHEGLTGAHNGTERIFQQVQERYYWPKIYEDIRGYVQTCDACQRRGNLKANNILHPIEPKTPFQRIGIDIVGPLIIIKKGNRYIVTAMDYFTKWLIAKAIKEATAKTVSKFIYEKIICEHGCPQVLQSNQGTHFVNRVIQDLSEKFRIKHRLSTPYHSQTNGLVERFNQTLCEKLAKMRPCGTSS